jgi:hypothetical protein
MFYLERHLRRGHGTVNRRLLVVLSSAFLAKTLQRSAADGAYGADYETPNNRDSAAVFQRVLYPRRDLLRGVDGTR